MKHILGIMLISLLLVSACGYQNFQTEIDNYETPDSNQEEPESDMILKKNNTDDINTTQQNTTINITDDINTTNINDTQINTTSINNTQDNETIINETDAAFGRCDRNDQSHCDILGVECDYDLGRCDISTR